MIAEIIPHPQLIEVNYRFQFPAHEIGVNNKHIISMHFQKLMVKLLTSSFDSLTPCGSTSDSLFAGLYTT